MDAWKEGGAKRVALHTLVGGLTAGAAGAVGAGTASAAAPKIEELQTSLKTALKEAGVGDSAANLIASLAGGATAAGIGGATGGGAGAATAFNADMNNRQLHPSEKEILKRKAADFSKKLKNAGYSSMTEERALAILTEQADNRIDETQAKRLDTATLDDYIKAEAQKFINQISSGLGTYDDGRGNQIRYFTNTTASGERLFQDYKNPSINAVPHVPAVDYVKAQAGAFGKSIGASVNTHDGTVFVDVGASPNFSGVSPNASLVGGKMLGGPETSSERADAVNEMLRGASASSTVCFAGLCGGLNQSIAPLGSNPPTAIEIGIGTPGASLGAGASVEIGKPR